MCGFRSDRREWLHAKLERLMEKIENDELPMHIKEVYLFGSFLKGKKDPRDIDILLIYDSDKTAKKYEYIDKKGRARWKMTALRRSPSKLRAHLKKNAERSLDLSICPSLEEFKKDLTKELDCCLRIWSETDRDWKGKLNEHFLRDLREDRYEP
ncbi:MAG: nucleotidyltransferase domain-containing protein [Methanomassiliicoccales archaeon]